MAMDFGRHIHIKERYVLDENSIMEDGVRSMSIDELRKATLQGNATALDELLRRKRVEADIICSSMLVLFAGDSTNSGCCL